MTRRHFAAENSFRGCISRPARPMNQSAQQPMPGLIPAFGWLRSYKASSLRFDVAAGVTLSLYLLPAPIGDASLAGLPPQAGLYACLFSGLVFWLFCSSK